MRRNTAITQVAGNGLLTVEDATRIFVNVNFEEDAQSQLGQVNEDKALMRHELIESLIRIAAHKFIPKVTEDLSDAVRMLVEDHVLPNLNPIARFEPEPAEWAAVDEGYGESMKMMSERLVGI